MQKQLILLSLVVSASCFGCGLCGTVAAEEGLIVDQTTGIRYRVERKTVKTPVTETVMSDKVVTEYRPRVVTDTEPVTRTYFTPVVRYDWQPRWHGLWNPFAPATLAYHYVPQTQWEARTETYARTTAATRWVAEQRVVSEPKLVTRMEDREVDELVAVDRLPTAPVSAGTQIARAPSTSPLAPSAGLHSISGSLVAPPAAAFPGAMPPTVLDAYSTQINVARSPNSTFYR